MNYIWQHRLLLQRSIGYKQIKNGSAWLNPARVDSDSTLSSTVDAEKLFIDKDVQTLLKDLTGLEMESKVFRERRTSIQQRSHFALMTDERLNKTLEKMREEAKHFLHFVPLKEPRPDGVETLAKDVEISNFDSSKYVFTDITFDATDQDRTVVVREVDGTLRTASAEEHDRMNRTYYHKENRPIFSPPVFEDPFLQNALDRREHEFVMDWACHFYEPDDPAFVKLSQTVFDRVIETGDFDALYSTRHFGSLVFYLALNGNIPPLLNHMGGQGRVKDCANLIRLQKTLHPDWRVSIGSGDSNEKIVQDFIKQNSRFRDKLGDLSRYMKDGTVKLARTVGANNVQGSSKSPASTRINSTNVNGSEGPLGELSSEYTVKVASGEEEKFNDDQKSNDGQKFGRRRQRFTPKPDGKSNDS